MMIWSSQQRNESFPHCISKRSNCPIFVGFLLDWEYRKSEWMFIEFALNWYTLFFLLFYLIIYLVMEKRNSLDRPNWNRESSQLPKVRKENKWVGMMGSHVPLIMTIDEQWSRDYLSNHDHVVQITIPTLPKFQITNPSTFVSKIFPFFFTIMTFAPKNLQL